MIVDHRTYTLLPGKMALFLDIYQRVGWPLQQQYLGDCVGWYVSMDIGPLNQVVHLWRYADLADRARRRAAMAADPAWAGYLEQAAPLIQHQENKILSAAPFYTG
ncbi:MAG: NIPSNAP family protein [Gammaproteobacteria bacterium]|nr:NIPSNAP family protein [Gammaproteobacteria bacterium]MCP5202101.1 NIPSNAP family protein [Gammaproteobacteria bacterium]